MGFPMEMARFPGKIRVVAHKPVAEAAGLGRMGIHRNVIHPKFGSFVLLGTVLVGAEIGEYSRPLEYNPCLSCKLCVAACPVEAIGPDGYFNFIRVPVAEPLVRAQLQVGLLPAKDFSRTLSSPCRTRRRPSAWFRDQTPRSASCVGSRTRRSSGLQTVSGH